MLKNPNRQVIMMGNHTLVITLPMDWVHANGIRPGMMIHLEEVVDVSTKNDKGLILRQVRPDEDRSIMEHRDRVARPTTGNPVRDEKA